MATIDVGDPGTSVFKGKPVAASYRGVNGNCGPANAWLCRSVQQAGLDTGHHVSLDLDASGVPRIAYRNASDDTLEYATYVGSGGDCGFSSQTFEYEWRCEVIDDMGPSIGDKVLALAHDNAGQVRLRRARALTSRRACG